MPFDPHDLDALDDGSAADDEDELDEDEDDPRTWDLTTGRAAADNPGRMDVLDITPADLITLVLDGVQPDGSLATDELRAAAALAWMEKDRELADKLCVALTGETLEGRRVDWQRRESAHRDLERRRRRYLESGEVMASPATGRGRRPAGRHALRVTTPDGGVEFAGLGNDDDAIAEAAVAISGIPIAEFLAPFKQGPQSDAERARRARQALTVAQLLERGATQRAIARVFGLSEAVVSARAAVGRELAKRMASANPNL